jgi:hypothetical protein
MFYQLLTPAFTEIPFVLTPDLGVPAHMPSGTVNPIPVFTSFQD